ncbi:E3 ubiquitin-protein ligase sina-like [Cylas formicarius]|uniref:E3 ubiquitin-protein ligase sina-like n=1 Tax=Cylas formicarius TaxID=197179 RepID=UPI002958BCBC|nr:E3 ubiquitin-protein ligase sina-like [Cylas formicarius]
MNSRSNSTSEPDKIMECPICSDTMTVPIIQCEVGHPMCQSCVTANNVRSCPICRGPMTNRRMLPLEQLIESIKDKLLVPCFFHTKGCQYTMKIEHKYEHESQCRYRNFKCEGKVFALWDCQWMGDYKDLYNHFKQVHKNTSMQYRTEANLKINFQSNHRDVQLISFFNGQSYFYYKHMVDVTRQKLYFTFQYVGLKSSAKNYYYEFEVHQGPVRKFKVTEICESDVVRAEDIFDSEKCVVMSFATAKTFLNSQGELPFKFRIMSSKKGDSKRI